MANFPGAISTNGNLYIAVNGLQTTLAVSCTSGDTTLTLTSTTGFPTTGLVTIDNTEIVSYTGVAGATITGCTRGADGTTAASHPIGVTVGLTVVAAHHNLLKDEVIAVETILGTTLTNPATPNATATSLMARDANANAKVNALVQNFATTATAAGTTTLTAASSPNQQFTGVTTQTVTLPNATTLSVGFQFTILNRSTGIVSVNNNGGSLQQAIPASAQTTFTCTNIGSANGVWDVSTSSASTLTAYREDYVVGTALNNYTGSLTVFDLVTAYSVGAHSLMVTLDGDVQTIGASVDYQETSSTRVTFVNALVAGQKVSFIFQTVSSSGGTVNSGTTGQVAYFPATGPTVSGTNDPTLVPVIALSTLNLDNILMNGGFEIWQRGTSFSNPAGATYTADRWKTDKGGGTPPTVDVSQSSANADTPGTYCLDINITGAGASSPYFSILQQLENFADFKGKTVTVSIRVKTSLTGVHIEAYDGVTSTIGSNHTGSGAYETITLTKTWSASATTFLLYVGFPTAGNITGTGHIYVDNAMLVYGSQAATFVPENPSMALMRCQRYYEKSTTNIVQSLPIEHSGSANNLYIPTQFKVTKRAVPTFTATKGAVFLYTTPTTGNAGITDTVNWTLGSSNPTVEGADYTLLNRSAGDQTTYSVAELQWSWTASAEL